MKSAMDNYSYIPKRIRSKALESLKEISEESNAQNRTTQQDILSILSSCIDSVSKNITQRSESEILDSESQFDSESTNNGFLIISNNAEILKRDSLIGNNSEEDLQMDGDEIMRLSNKLAFTYSITSASERSDEDREELGFSTDNLEVKTGIMKREQASGKSISEKEYSVLLPKDNVLGDGIGRKLADETVENKYVYNFIKWNTNLRKGLSVNSTLVSNILQFNMLDEYGSSVRILNLSDPIIVQMRIESGDTSAESCTKLHISCAAFDLYERRYRTDGLQLVTYQCHNGIGTATCATNHLSEFALLNNTIQSDGGDDVNGGTTDQVATNDTQNDRNKQDDKEDEYSRINSPGIYTQFIYIYIYIYSLYI